jgi:LmbE family N-acetylglucosaminyl deacetylase
MLTSETTPERVLVVSPHLDDGVLSIGGTLAQLASAGSLILVATMFTGPPPAPLSPAAHAFHTQCGLGDDAMLWRQAEDQRACRTIGAAHWHAGLPEALYRVDQRGLHRYPDGRAIFNADPHAEPDTIDAVEHATQNLLDQLHPDLVIAPLGVGGHIDHTITHIALQRRDIPPDRLRWYEDLPYALYEHLTGWEDTHTNGLIPDLVLLNESDIHLKLEAIASYTSQLAILWHNQAPWRHQLGNYARHIGRGQPAERLWLETGPSADHYPLVATRTEALELRGPHEVDGIENKAKSHDVGWLPDGQHSSPLD